MKPSPRTFKIQWDVHAWSGVLASVVLFVVFYCGIFALFHSELTVWQDASTLEASGETAPSSWDELLERVTPEVPLDASVVVRNYAVHTSISVYRADGESLEARFERARWSEAPEHSRLADELYELHFLEQIPGGLELSGLAALALGVALVSGLVIQWKDLLPQLVRIRPRLAPRYWSSDLHKVFGVFSLPFTFVYVWSGVLLGLWAWISAPLVYLSFEGDESRFNRARGDEVSKSASGEATNVLSLEHLIRRGQTLAEERWGAETELRLERVEVDHQGRSNSTARVDFAAENAFSDGKSVIVRSTDGALVRFVAGASPSQVWERILYALHYADFGGVLVKILYSLFAVVTCVVIVTGNVVWLERRDAARRQSSSRFLERATVGGCLGLVVASVSYAVANRLLPRPIHDRASVEFAIFSTVWVAVVLVASFTPMRARRLSSLLAVVAGVLALAFGHRRCVRVPRFVSGTSADGRAVRVGLSLTCFVVAGVLFRGNSRSK